MSEGVSSSSQMAEGLARYIGPAHLAYHSASLITAPLHPLAVKAMREIGVDISEYRVKQIGEVDLGEISTVVKLYKKKRGTPRLPAGILSLSWPVGEPAKAGGDEEELLHTFRRTRDQIRELISRLF
ncbi:arsenate reductase [Haliangium ochraceum]|uniref:arsenate reductase n=1 Tax=Haliangium ochraceum TaxID=80816 RepID=UPI00126A67F3|nr:arsenate reductase [Haliangium ochraceum]